MIALPGCAIEHISSGYGQIYSLEFGHTTGSSDYCALEELPDDFGRGFLFSAWTRITVPIEAGGVRGNQNILYLYGDNWTLMALNGNISNSDSTNWFYNANYELLEGDASDGKGDYCLYQSTISEGLTQDQCNGWVWSAWQVVVNDDRTITMRQWLKFGLEGEVFSAGNYLYDNSYNWIGWLDPLGEETTGTLDIVPSAPRAFRIGHDNTSEGLNNPSSSYICRARVEARSSKPTLDELEAIARADSADESAWGDWELSWKNGGPNLSDRSGNGNHLSIEIGGALYQGALSPDF